MRIEADELVWKAEGRSAPLLSGMLWVSSAMALRLSALVCLNIGASC